MCVCKKREERFIRIVSERFDMSREVDEGRDEGRARER